jgi:hypothetical protein
LLLKEDLFNAPVGDGSSPALEVHAAETGSSAFGASAISQNEMDVSLPIASEAARKVLKTILPDSVRRRLLVLENVRTNEGLFDAESIFTDGWEPR